VIDDDLSCNVVQLTLACAEFDSHDAPSKCFYARSERGSFHTGKTLSGSPQSSRSVNLSNDNGNRYPSMEQRADKKQSY
jgi:hypothetical protein